MSGCVSGSVSGCVSGPTTIDIAAPRAHALRFGPGADVLVSLKSYASVKHLKAASIVSAVGSLRQVNLRYANQGTAKKQNGFFEITSLSGIITEDGAHVHISVADEAGQTLGGHLADENLIYTTLEVVLLEYPDLLFTRELDPASGYKELVIKKR